MCGFAGFTGPSDHELLARMGERIRHRGPDQDGVFEADGCSFAHKRLSIIDLSEAGRQPMTTADGRFTVAYNGEIYNYRELRARYEADGWTFRTHTDTECLLASAALHQLRDLDQFHGMFAFVLWDAESRQLLFARDRMGIKPLFITEHNGCLGFASEIQGLLPLRSGWTVDPVARSMYLAAGYVPGPRTIFSGISSVDPGQVFRFADGKFSALFDFSKGVAVPCGTRADMREQLVATVDRVVGEQLVSDRPVGVFLSGGLDSTVVLSAMRKQQPSGTIQTFTTRFVDNANDPKFNVDAELAKRVADVYGCEHHEIDVGPEAFLSAANDVARHLGQPHNNSSTIALDVAAGLAQQSVSVVLSGDGGDELFGGYRRYQLYSAVAPVLRHPATRSVVRAGARLHRRGEAWADLLNADSEAQRLLFFHALPFAERRKFFGEAADDTSILSLWNDHLDAMEETDVVSRFMALDRATWLRDDAFVRSDRVTMRHGLELRVPLTDDALVDFARTLPRSWLVDYVQSKKIWREAFSSRTLPEITTGAKRGWITPAAKWLRSGLREWAQSNLEEAIRTHAWMNGAALRTALDDHLNHRHYRLIEVWTALSYHLWWKAYRSDIAG